MIRWLDEVGADDHLSVGGKAASLGELARLGLRVPPGFALGIAAFEQFYDSRGLRQQIAAALAGMDHEDVVDVARRCAHVRDLIRTTPLEGAVETVLRTAYAELGATCDLPVAVRSSARGEDSAGASFAGEHDTYLWVVGADAVIDAVRNCWASLFTDRATCYREKMHIGHATVAMAVVVQKMVRPRTAGVAFTLDPSNGDRSAIAIDASWGFGEAVASGEVTPDSFLVDKVHLTITRSVISRKNCEYRIDDEMQLVKVDLEEPRATSPSLLDDEVVAIARLAKQVEKHFGCPQDLEWALDSDLPADDSVTLLQTRPETVWTRRVEDNDYSAAPADYLSGIVSTLMAPLQAQRDD